MMPSPLFTVITACYNRGRHILPTIESVLAQSLTDIELIVVFDGPDNDAFALLPTDDTRIRTVILPSNSGSQSTPNNAGLEMARGEFVAYLGHDDLWMRDHLVNLTKCFSEKECDVAVAGCAFHGPPGTDLVYITGLFDEPVAARSHFFPPSSLAHRRRLPIDNPFWRLPEAIAAPVDADFLLRAEQAGALFASTGRISTHKFAAGHRYLSYLEPSSDEQNAFLAEIRSGAIDQAYESDLIDRAKAAGTFMVICYPDWSTMRKGQNYRDNRSNKGLDRVAPKQLTCEEHVPVTAEPRALDWYPSEIEPGDGKPYRWSGPSLRPKLLIPFMGDLSAGITLHLYDSDPANVIDQLKIEFNGNLMSHAIRRTPDGMAHLSFSAHLPAYRSSVVELILPGYYCAADKVGGADSRRLGVKFGGFTIAPEKWHSNLWRAFSSLRVNGRI